ncbi:MAG: DUF805 domain-containing protein [Pseudomonadota bacterium]
MSNPQNAPHGSLSISALLLSPNGRITQGQYWGGVVFIVIANIIVNYIGALGLLLWAFLIFVGFCVYGKRLHDVGKSTWTHAIVWVVVLIITIGSLVLSWDGIEQIAGLFDPNNPLNEDELREQITRLGPEFAAEFIPIILASLVTGLIWLIYTIWLGSLPSQKFDNRFGQGPSGDVF